MLYELLYSSASTQQMHSSELLQLLEHARQKNTRLQISGMLLYHRHEFMQIIEGEKDTVLRLWKKIHADERHSSPSVIYEGPITDRGFAGWSMGFRDLDHVDPRAMEQVSGFLDNGFTSEVVAKNPSTARKLMTILRASLADR